MPGIVWIIIAIFILVVAFSGNKTSAKKKSNASKLKKKSYQDKHARIYIEQDRPASVQNANLNQMTTSSVHQPIHSDEGIIDVTGNSVELKKLSKYEKDIPYWKHQYVYSHSEIHRATAEQQKFYSEFKYHFLRNEFLDVEGNSNYYFILLFDLHDNDYPIHKDINLLEKQLDDLGFYYPKTSPYARSLLLKKMQGLEDRQNIRRVLEKPSHVNIYNPTGSYEFTQNYWGLGTKYKTKLDLSDDQVKILNGVPFPENNFLSVEFCKLEVIRFFLKYIATLNERYTAQGKTLDQEFKALGNIIASKQYQHKQDNSYYNYTVESIINEIYTSIFKHSENTVREAYGHKRKLNAECIYTNPEVKSQFESVIFSIFQEIKPSLLDSIKKPSKGTEIALNAQNTTRWKLQFDHIENKHLKNTEKFVNEINKLAELNQKNPAIENIFLEASKTIAKLDKEASLRLYMHYLYHDLKSTTFDNRQLTKTIQKSLFKTNEQLHEFEKIVSGLTNDKNLQYALDQIPNIYAVKRKQIKLDKASIQDVQQQHSGTVELLNEYLNDEYQDDHTTIIAKENNNDEVTIQIQSRSESEPATMLCKGVNLTDIQKLMLDIFVKANFSVPQAEIEAFAKERNLFRNQLIESVNDSCYETLDDILIEEEEDYYQINEEYYKTILQ
jgi:hypothetical protein